MSTLDIENSLCEAIEILVDDAIAKADFDRTILCTVVECADKTVGKYRVKFQDSIFYAFAGSPDTYYSNGADVYVLIPNNDMSKDKRIIGTTKQLGTNYIDTSAEEDRYIENGKNCIISQSANGYRIKSYQDSTTIELYKEGEGGKNGFAIDVDGLTQYIKDSSALILKTIVQTNLEPRQQQRGNYGITIEMVFADNASGKDVVREYTLDVNSMIGNPYLLTLPTSQSKIFAIDGVNFKRIHSIKLFANNFPLNFTGTELQQKPYDIILKDFELFVGNKLSDADLGGCIITFNTPKGTIFTVGSSSEDELPVQAQLRVKGKVVDESSQKIEFYWFREDVSVSASSEYYCKYGGRGWRCLNEFNVIQQEGSDTKRLVEWIPQSSTFNVKYMQATAKANKFKCVALYDGNSVSKEFIIHNRNSAEVSIESSDGTEFFYDVGSPTLKCLIDGKSVADTADTVYQFHWAIEDSFGNLTQLEESVTENDEYNRTVKKKAELEADIEAGHKFLEANKELLEGYDEVIESYNSIQRVERDYLHHVDISKITQFASFKCSVYKTVKGVEAYVGTASITLTNTLEGEKPRYTLILNDANQIYKYDEYGKSPFVTSKDTGKVIPNLTFTIFDEFGRKLDDEVITGDYCSWRWVVPIKNTMLSIPSTVDDHKGGTDALREHQYYNNLKSLPYTIASSYSYINTENQITLELEYQGYAMQATTNLSLIKEGENGTNGTDYVVKIVPNVSNLSTAPLYPMVTAAKNADYGLLNFTSLQGGNRIGNLDTNKNKLFRLQLWKNNDLIIDSTESVSIDGTFCQINWEVLRNIYQRVSPVIQDDSNFSVAGDYFKFNSAEFANPANIIQGSVTFEGKTYYGTIPIITVVPVGGAKYSAKFGDYNGYRYVQYDTNGIHPKYDNAKPFEVKVFENINNFIEDISLLSEPPRDITYEWNIYGSIKAKKDSNWQEVLTNVLQKMNYSKVEKNQCDIKPVNTFDGLSVNNGIYLVVKNGGNEILHAKFPVHLYLNRYGLANINAWDGNSVKLDEEEGFILSPQVGAGKKNADNSFTGVFMGEVRESQFDNKSKTGLFGYSEGVRSFFLNADNGSAIFGKRQMGNSDAPAGQIIIDPSISKALLYSSNYWKNYNEDTGLPQNYNSTNENKQGMLIDLSTPEIKFGTGNFSVTSDGHLTAKGGGSIAGWNIDDYKIYKDNTGMSSVTDVNAIGVTKKDVKIPSSADSGYDTVSKAIAFWAGNNNFFVTHDGYLKINEATVGKGANPIFIGKSAGGEYSALFSGKKNNFSADSSGFYIGTDGIALGNYYEGRSSFQVTSNGELTAKSGYIGNGSKGWTIAASALYNGKQSYNDGNNGVYIGTNGIGLGPGSFYVTSGGALHSTSGDIAGWQISSSQLHNADNSIYLGTAGIKFKDSFSINSSGHLTCTNANVTGSIYSGNGRIGGWIINQSSIQAASGGLTLNSNSAINGTSWSISSNGVASFTNSLSAGGSTFSGGSGGSTYLPAGGGIGGAGAACFTGGTALGQYVGDLVVDKLQANDIETINFKGGQGSITVRPGYITLNGRTDFTNQVQFHDEVLSWENLRLQGKVTSQGYEGVTGNYSDVTGFSTHLGIVTAVTTD